MYLGIAGYFSTRLFEQPAKAGQLASLLLDERWPWRLESVVFGLRAAWDKRSRRVKLTGKDVRIRLSEGMMNSEHREAELDHRANAEDNHARLAVDTGQRFAAASWPNPAELTSIVRGTELSPTADLQAWLEVMHQIMVTVDVANAVISPWPTERMASSDVTLGRRGRGSAAFAGHRRASLASHVRVRGDHLSCRLRRAGSAPARCKECR